MQPHNPMLDTYRKLSGDVVERVSPVLQTSFLAAENEKDSPNLRKAKATWRPVPKLLSDVDAALVALGEGVFSIAIDERLTADAKTADIAALTDSVRQTINGTTSDVLARADQILAATRADAYPARPLPVDATQEAALAGLKADLRMVWDTINADHVTAAMADSLKRAIADDDKLALWLLASSRWPEDYLTSRGETIRRDVWADEVAAILDAASPTRLADARRIYNTLADGRLGLPLLRVLFAQLAPIVDDVATWRPSSGAPTPWTRAS